MSERFPGFEIDEDPTFEKREWVVQRIVLVLLILALGLVAAGLFGNGPISRRTTTAADGDVELEYQRFVRNRGISSLRFTIDPSASTTTR